MLIEQKIERARLSQSQQLIADYLLEKRSNIKDMVLSDEVVESVKNKQGTSCSNIYINGNDYQISQKIGISWL